jgi:hypothetical protein
MHLTNISNALHEFVNFSFHVIYYQGVESAPACVEIMFWLKVDHFNSLYYVIKDGN